jgi:riboflavin biosynthesis pyrimidine reductase
MGPLLRLYPLPTQEIPLQGAYLEHDLRQFAGQTGNAFVYANFITSLDGRIAISDPSGPGLVVPKDTANERDWRLFQELAAQADLIISTGRYLRDWEKGRAQEILQVDDPRFADLRVWRQDRGLPPQPDIAVISGSLIFPIPEVLKAGGRKVVIFTTGSPDPVRVAEIEAQAGRVIVAGESSVNGEIMLKNLTALGYHTIYSAAGPKVLHLLLSAGTLDRLYLTYANRILGADRFATKVEGSRFDPPVDFKIAQVYLDSVGLDGLGQLCVVYERAYPPPNPRNRAPTA